MSILPAFMESTSRVVAEMDKAVGDRTEAACVSEQFPLL
jgi:hypothetical protein